MTDELERIQLEPEENNHYSYDPPHSEPRCTLQSVMAESSQPHAALQSHLFPSFSALSIHDAAGAHGKSRNSNSSKKSRLQRTKVGAHKLRTKLHEWEEKLEQETHIRAPLGLPRAMPDMRFEQSYLATVRGFVHELRPEDTAEEKHAVLESRAEGDAPPDEAIFNEKQGSGNSDEERLPKVVATVTRTPEPELWLGNLKIDWYVLSRYPLVWVTFRDQVVSPLIQGTVWGLAGLMFAQTRAFILDQRRLARQASAAGGHAATGGKRAEKAGPGVSLLRALGLGRR
ncbi:hypothetical protein OC835_007418 [Tilletia horrida]|nr:hypothetical protein OC835_007418 [Tilletia horrida]